MWRKIPDWLFYLIIVVLIYANSNRASEKISPPSSPPDIGSMLPSESPRDERVIVNIEKPSSGIGTAFAINNNGQWITARHVVDSCNEVGINIGGLKILRTSTDVSSKVSRTKGLFGPLGGLSGAPALDKDGEVIGVVSAESPRRGRIYTVTPENLRTLITNRDGTPSALNLDTYGIQADKLRRDRRIAQVVCMVN